MTGPLQANHPTSRRPIFTLLSALFIPLAYIVCFLYVRDTAHPDFVGFDLARAVRHSHFPASVFALLLSLLALRRREKFRPLGWLLLTLSVLWLLYVLLFVLFLTGI